MLSRNQNKSDEEELYAGYLAQLPWSIKITIIEESGQEIIINNDCFFYYNCFYYKNNNKLPISLGAGIHANEDQLYIFFDESTFEEKGKGLTRIFWSLTSINNYISETETINIVRPLPHFYGELAKTNEGCTYILSNDEFNIDLQQFILTVHSAYLNINDNKEQKNNYMIDSQGGLVDNNSNLQLRSCLWALGMIGSSKTGLNLLNSLCNNSNDINIIDDIQLYINKRITNIINTWYMFICIRFIITYTNWYESIKKI